MDHRWNPEAADVRQAGTLQVPQKVLYHLGSYERVEQEIFFWEDRIRYHEYQADFWRGQSAAWKEQVESLGEELKKDDLVMIESFESKAARFDANASHCRERLDNFRAILNGDNCSAQK